MELIILKEAWSDLWLLTKSKTANRGRDCGYLLGRKMTQAYIVQKVCLYPWEDLLQPDFFLKVEKEQKLKILGIFCLKPTTAKKKEFGQPLFGEKIFLSLGTDYQDETKIEAWTLHFDGRFFLEKVQRISLEMEANGE
ncbi:MAG: hypothetical protein ACPLZD_06070 [Candidatus Saccharicenans sp.]|nr:MAG: hypothetical protein C0168_03355 [Candidatus Aminicenantes bacterium]HEK85415.1 hypothetical protein [Candidatus Aminicenantes bacterium]